MGVWRHRDDGQVECLRHGLVFPMAHECADCITDPPPDEAGPPPAEYTYGLIEHEREFERVAKVASGLADEVVSGVRAVGERSDPMTVAAKLMDVSIKARRAAAELCQGREAQQRVERLEHGLGRFRRGQPAAQVSDAH